MRKRTLIIVTAVTICCYFAVVIGISYALYHETISMQNHLVAGSLNASLVRTKLTTINLGSDGNFQTTVDDSPKDFSTGSDDNIFGITQNMKVAPSSKFIAEMSVTNKGDVAFYYYVEVVFNSMISDSTFASMLKFTVSTSKGVTREVLISDGLTLGDDENGLGEVEVGESETFTVSLEFLDSQNNNKVENKFVQFDLRVHVIQKVAA